MMPDLTLTLGHVAFEWVGMTHWSAFALLSTRSTDAPTGGFKEDERAARSNRKVAADLPPNSWGGALSSLF
ncbi:MAG: hypothetical protein EXS30_04695 [Pedosphaera sp.]|nr:hypothetical protein [Pedosphaera sp.]